MNTPQPFPAAPRARLTPSDAAEIRRLRAEGATYRELSARYLVSHHAIANIIQRRTYRGEP